MKQPKNRPPGPSTGRLIARSEAARLKSVSLSAVSHACEPGGPLAAAVHGRKLDADHPDFVAWLVTGDAPTRGKLSEVVYRKKLAEAERLESRNARDDGRIVSKELVRKHVTGLVSELTRRLLENAPRTIASRMTAMVQSGSTHEQRVALVQGILSTEIRHSKKRIVGNLRSETALRAGETPPPVTETTIVDDKVTKAIDTYAAALRLAMQTEAAPRVVDAMSRSVARVAGPDGHFDGPTFDRVLEAVQTIAADAVRQAATILTAHVDAVANTIRQEATDAETDPTD